MSDTIVSDTGAEPPFRAEHVGSLLRPAALLAARAEYEGGWITAGMLRETEDDCIRHAVVMQAELGLRGSQTASFAAAPGTWIFSIRSAASKRPTARCISNSKTRPERSNSRRRRTELPAGYPRQDDFRRGFRLPQIGRATGYDAEADDPVAIDAALPRRAGRDRSRCLP